MSHKEAATRSFTTVEGDLKEISRWMYDNPETPYEEFESSGRLARFLEENGFEVSYPAYGLETAFEANVGSDGPRVVICAEYDALPGVGHACGHNIIATSALGAGVAVAGLADELGIRVTVLGTPAEEGGGGKIELIEAGAFEDAVASMMVHPSQRNAVDPAFLAAVGYKLEYFGKEAHAAFAPHVGVNALDAFVQAYNSVSTLRQQFLPTDRVHCSVSEGGVAPNVITAYTRSEWIVRSTTGERLTELTEKVRACWEAAATATGCRVEITQVQPPYVDMVNNRLMCETFKANAESIGREMPWLSETGTEAAASSDMGNVSHVLPSIHPVLGIETDAVNHQPEFAAATVTPSGEQAIRDGALAMAHTIIDMATQDVWDRL